LEFFNSIGKSCRPRILIQIGRSTSLSRLRFRKLAELGHGDPAQGERRHGVPKRDPLERAQGVACLECSPPP
jgi:hypothetical protein